MSDPEAGFTTADTRRMNRSEYKNYLMNEYLSRASNPSAQAIEYSRQVINRKVDRMTDDVFENAQHVSAKLILKIIQKLLFQFEKWLYLHAESILYAF